jgi:hypothetical protein
MDQRQLNKLDLFYRSAFQFFYTTQKAGQIYGLFVLGVSIIVFWLIAYFYGANTFLDYIIASFAGGILSGPGTLIFLPVYFIIRNYSIRSRLRRMEKLLVENGFSRQEVLAAKGWLNQQERRPEDYKLKHKLGELLNERLAQLENIGIHTPRPVTIGQIHLMSS